MIAKEWSEEETEYLKQAASARQSGAAIAAGMSERFGRNFTRNAVLGRASRLGIQVGIPKPPGAAGKKQKRIRPAAVGRLLIRRAPPPVVSKEARVYTSKTPDPAPALGEDGKPFTLMTIPDNGCRWIITRDISPAQFCGHQKAKLGGSYCEIHMRKSWLGGVSAAESRKQEARDEEVLEDA